MVSVSDPLIRSMVRDDSLTRGLGDIEARMLIEWLVDWAELLIDAAQTETEAESLLGRLGRRGRAIGRFVQLWNEPDSRGAAAQLAAAERFEWPFPTRRVEAPDLMQHILNWENQQRGQ